jgi:hypothetical protein
MWIYDGEEWTQEGGSGDSRKPETTTPRFDEFTPELQVIEILPVVPGRSDLPFPGLR